MITVVRMMVGRPDGRRLSSGGWWWRASRGDHHRHQWARAAPTNAAAGGTRTTGVCHLVAASQPADVAVVWQAQHPIFEEKDGDDGPAHSYMYVPVTAC